MSKTERSVSITRAVILAVLIAFFFGTLIRCGIGFYNDSHQYVDLHVRREPAYPVFLYLIRCVFGDHWMIATGVIQTLIVIVFSYNFILYITEVSGCRPVWSYLICAFVLLPYIITPLASNFHVVLSTSIMSESVAMPLFLQFFICMHRALMRGEKAQIVSGLLLALLISLIRTNLIVLIIVWLIVALVVYIPRKQKLAILLAVMAFISAFAARNVITRCYNLAFNGRFISNEFTGQTAMANIMYITDPAIADSIDDPDLRSVFEQLYEKMDEAGWSSAYAPGDSVFDRAVFLEDAHDRIKFDIVEFGLRDIVEATGIHDYIDYNIVAEEYCGKLIPILLPACLSRWIPDMLIMGLRGVVRNVSVCTPLGYVICVLWFAAAISIMIMLFKKDRRSPGAWMIALCILIILGNAFGTSMIIMCLARYMIYGITMAYSVLFAGAAELYRRHRM